MTTTTSDDLQPGEADATVAHNHGAVFWVTAALGAAIVVFGVWGLFENEPAGAPSAIRWFIGGALVLDLVVVPLGALAGYIGKRVLPGWAWPVVRAALLVSVGLIVFAAPLVLDKGGLADNPTVRPRNYDAGLAIALGGTWVAAATALVVRRTWKAGDR